MVAHGRYSIIMCEKKGKGRKGRKENSQYHVVHVLVRGQDCTLQSDKNIFYVIPPIVNSSDTQHISLLRNFPYSSYKSPLLDLKPTYSGSVSEEKVNS